VAEMTSQQIADELLAEYWAEKAKYERELNLVRKEMECPEITCSPSSSPSQGASQSHV
jgi:hypothetical protein